MRRSVALLALCAATFAGRLAMAANSGDLVVSGFEPGQAWAGSSYVVAAAWPDAFQGAYALHAKDSNQSKRWPLTGSFSETTLSIRLHFRVQSDNLQFDPDHDGAPFEQLTLVGVLPKNGASHRPNVAIKRDDDVLVLRIEDYSTFQFVYPAVVVPDRWHVLDLLLDQTTNRYAVALDGALVFDDRAADLGAGTPFTAVEFGLVYTTRNGNSLWFDDVRIRDDAALQGPELIASATATPGVGAAPFTTAFSVSTTATNPTIEWDFEGDGIFDATGYTANRTWSTSGTWRPVARVTNSSGRAVAYPPIVQATAANAPTVQVQSLSGGSPTTAFPRIFDLSAAITPAAGAKIAKVEWDWWGGGVYGWNSRTPWLAGSAITVRTPHEYAFDAPTAVVRARATDDAGRVGVGELALTLPVGPGNPVIPARDPRAGIYMTYGWPELYVNRGATLPSWIAGCDVSAYFTWAEIETADNVFDFGPVGGGSPYTYNGRIAQIVNAGKNVILRHRNPFPSWLLAKVAKSNKTNNEGYTYPQFWDPRYQTYLRRFIQAQATNLQSILALHPSWGSRFVINRGQALSIDTEAIPTGQFPVIAYPGTQWSMALTAANFTAPSSGAYPVDYTPQLATVYAETLRTFYDEAFGPLGVPSVFKPYGGGYYNVGDSIRADAEFRGSVCDAGFGFFITDARPETGQDHWFLGYTDRGLAHGFHEADGNSSAPHATVQVQYWTLLSELNCGTEYVGTWGDYAWFLEYQAEYESEPIYSFVNRHVGWKPRPTLAPAAFLALKPFTTPPGETFVTGPYGALLTEADDSGSDVANVGSIHYTYKGPTNLGHPATIDEPMQWARSCPAFGQLRFAVDDAFRNAHGTAFDLEVVFLDSYQGRFFVRCKNQAGILKYYVVPMSGDGKWHRAVVPMKGAQLHDDLGPGQDLALEADTQATVFHRIVLTPK